MSGLNYIYSTGISNVTWQTTGTMSWVTPPYPWDKATLQGKVKDAHEYIKHLKESRERLREILGG